MAKTKILLTILLFFTANIALAKPIPKFEDYDWGLDKNKVEEILKSKGKVVRVREVAPEDAKIFETTLLYEDEIFKNKCEISLSFTSKHGLFVVALEWRDVNQFNAKELKINLLTVLENKYGSDYEHKPDIGGLEYFVWKKDNKFVHLLTDYPFNPDSIKKFSFYVTYGDNKAFEEFQQLRERNKEIEQLKDAEKF